MNIGYIYAKEGRTDSADKAYVTAFDMYDQLGKKDKLAGAGVRLANIRATEGAYSGATVLANNALSLAKVEGNTKIMHRAKRCLKRIRKKQKS